MFEKNLADALRKAGLSDKEMTFIASHPDLAKKIAAAAHEYLYESEAATEQQQTPNSPSTLRGYYDKGPETHQFGADEMLWADVLSLDINRIILKPTQSRHDSYEVLIGRRLKHRQILTVKDLLLCSKSVLGSIKNIGAGRIAYIQAQLRLYNLRLTEMADIKDNNWINHRQARHPHIIDADCLPHESFLNLSASTIRGLNQPDVRLESFISFGLEHEVVVRTTDCNFTLSEITLIKSYFQKREFTVKVE